MVRVPSDAVIGSLVFKGRHWWFGFPGTLRLVVRVSRDAVIGGLDKVTGGLSKTWQLIIITILVLPAFVWPDLASCSLLFDPFRPSVHVRYFDLTRPSPLARSGRSSVPTCPYRPSTRRPSVSSTPRRASRCDFPASCACETTRRRSRPPRRSRSPTCTTARTRWAP